MNIVFFRVLKIIAVTCTVFVLTGCYSNGTADGSASAKEKIKLSAWITYWDFDAGKQEVKQVQKRVEKLAFFGAYFDKQDQLFIPQEMIAQKAAMKKESGKYETYLTFVNDKENTDGSVIYKDTEVLQRIFSTDESMEKHIDDMIEMTLKGGYDGIELDYEKIWKNKEVGQNFLRFSSKLYKKAQQHHLKMRIVLEPSTPFSADTFVKGPEYVVMFYNLYGLHSGPGPKADKVFIEKTIDKMAVLPGEKSVAFATGGCRWGSNGEKNFITEVEAKTLASTYKVETKRDEASQCVVFSYQDGTIQYHVWYADVKTLNSWISVAKNKGMHNISIWRLGGNAAIHKIK